jgi:hypothetical protein
VHPSKDLTTMSVQRLVATIFLTAASLVAIALPSVDAVQAEVQRGNSSTPRP